MLSAKEQRALREIEHGLRHDDRWFGPHLVLVRIRDLRYRRSARVCLVIELAFLALAVIGAVFALPELVMLGAGLGLLLPMVAILIWFPPPDPPDRPPPSGTGERHESADGQKVTGTRASRCSVVWLTVTRWGM